MTINNPKRGNPYRTGYVDYIMGRESDCPWKGTHNFVKQVLYVKGYLAAQANGIRLNDDLKQEMDKQDGQ